MKKAEAERKQIFFSASVLFFISEYYTVIAENQ